MGFLSGLVSDMIRESTGYDVRKVTRLVGGKNILMLGAGAALAGGVAGAFQQQKGGQAQTSSASAWDAPRGPSAPPPTGPPPAVPPPSAPSTLPSMAAASIPSPASIPAVPIPAVPVPTSAPAPAPEAAAADEHEEPELSNELTFAIVRSMVAAALSDGRLDQKEKQIVLERLDQSGLEPEQKQQVHRDLVLPPSPADLAAMVEEDSQREAIYRLAGLVILADGNISDLERSWLNRLAAAFGFEKARKSALEGEIFA